MDLDDALFCSVDIETTGLDSKKDEMIAFASMPIRKGKIIVHEAYYALIKSENYRIDAMKYHGIGERDLENMPEFEKVAGEILQETEGVLVGHTIQFDYEFLKKHFRKIGIKLKRETVDVVKLQAWLEKKGGRPAPDLTLDGLMKRYDLKSCYRHNAFADAFFTAQIFQLQLSEISRFGVTSVKELIRIGSGGSMLWRYFVPQ